ncbi:MAG: hypothetical protein ACOC5T_00410 [Elusimicrobiota bacterium]
MEEDFTAIIDFIREAIGYNAESDIELFKRINLKESEGGFYSQWGIKDEKYFYTIYVPEKKKELTFFNRLTLLHEVGHIIFNEMLYNNPTKLERILAHIHSEHRFFVFLQRIWYWNPLIRKIKIKLGFSFDIQYSAEDLYNKDVNLIINRADNELFCDYFALFVKKKYNFLLDR